MATVCTDGISIGARKVWRYRWLSRVCVGSWALSRKSQLCLSPLIKYEYIHSTVVQSVYEISVCNSAGFLTQLPNKILLQNKVENTVKKEKYSGKCQW